MTSPKDKVSSSTGAADQYLQPALADANALYQKGIGRRSYQGDILAPLNADTQNAFNMTRQLAGQPVPGLAEATNYNTGLISNGGYTDELRQAQSSLTPFADGSLHEDPRMKELLETNANRALNGAATRFGNGRFGSAAIGQGVGNAVADANNGIMLQSNENGRNRQLQASGLLGNMAEGARGAVFQANSQIPMLDNARYAGAERLAGIGDYYQNRAQTEKDANITNFNNNRFNADAWNNFNQYMSGLQGLGGQRKTTTTPGPSKAQSLIGNAGSGAIAGGALAGPWGAAIGGVGGGLLGMFG